MGNEGEALWKAIFLVGRDFMRTMTFTETTENTWKQLQITIGLHQTFRNITSVLPTTVLETQLTTWSFTSIFSICFKYPLVWSWQGQIAKIDFWKKTDETLFVQTNRAFGLALSHRKRRHLSSGYPTHGTVFIGNTLVSAVWLNGYFKQEAVSGGLVELWVERWCWCSHAV